MVVLDGMHRVKALNLMGYTKVPALLVDYMTRYVLVYGWARVVKIQESLIYKMLKEMGLNFRVAERSEALRSLGERLTSFIVLMGNRGLLIGEFIDIMNSYRILHSLERKLLDRGCKIEYVSDDFIPNSKVILMAPRVRKGEVLMKALEGELFPPKTTRHIVLGSLNHRTLRIHYPLEELR